MKAMRLALLSALIIVAQFSLPATVVAQSTAACVTVEEDLGRACTFSGKSGFCARSETGGVYCRPNDLDVPSVIGGGGPGGSSSVIGGGGPGGSSSVIGGGGPAPAVGLENPLGTTDLMTLLNRILDFVIRIGAIVIIFMLVHVGYLFATGSVNPKNIEDARGYLWWVVVGALILLGSKAIALGIEATVRALSVGK